MADMHRVKPILLAALAGLTVNVAVRAAEGTPPSDIPVDIPEAPVTTITVEVGLPPIPPSIGEPAYSCPEYTRGRVLAGELQTLKCDVSPPQKLDIQMFKGRLHGESARQRCNDMGGHYYARKNKCNGVDY